MTLNLIEALKTSIYNPKHTKRMKIHFNFSNCSKNRYQYFSKNKKNVQKTTAFYFGLNGSIYIFC